MGFIGKPACGKGKQAEILSDAGVPTQRSSGILDELPVEHHLNRMRCAGNLIPGGEMAKLVIDKLAHRQHPDLIFLDGSPRSVEELEVLVPGFSDIDYHLMLIHFEISDELALMRRMSQNAGGEVRLDAGTEKERLITFTKQTLPVIERARHMDVPIKTIQVTDTATPMYIAFQVMGKVSRQAFLHPSAH